MVRDDCRLSRYDFKSSDPPSVYGARGRLDSLRVARMHRLIFGGTSLLGCSTRGAGRERLEGREEEFSSPRDRILLCLVAGLAALGRSFRSNA